MIASSYSSFTSILIAFILIKANASFVLGSFLHATTWRENGMMVFSTRQRPYHNHLKQQQHFYQRPIPPTVSDYFSLSSSTGTTRLAASSASALNAYGDALFTQVISDVDDTLKSSGGVNIAGVALGGIDVQYERGDFYPGVAEFMLQISLGLRRPNPTPPNVCILTARAEEFKVALELKQDSSLAVAFRTAGEAEGIRGGWGLGPVLYGSVAEWIVQYRKGLRKFTNFERLIQQDPTGTIINYVYVGDTGELDQEAGETMLREYPTYCKAVFLHVVSDVPGAYVPVPPPKLINGRPIVFFRTYVGAALAATQLRLMTVDGLRKVIDAACVKLEKVPQNSDRWIDLIRDMERAEQVLKRF